MDTPSEKSGFWQLNLVVKSNISVMFLFFGKNKPCNNFSRIKHIHVKINNEIITSGIFFTQNLFILFSRFCFVFARQ